MTFSQFLAAYWSVFFAFLAGALITGIIYNLLVSWMHRHGYNEGYTWLQVVVGVTMTLIIAAAFLFLAGQPLLPVFIVFVFFCLTGLPMAAGDIWRYMQARKAETE